MRAGKDDGHMRRALTWVGGLATSTAAGALGQMLAAAAIALLGGGGWGSGRAAIFWGWVPSAATEPSTPLNTRP